MTKKEFKETSNQQLYSGRGIRINAIFFDFKQGYTDSGKYFGGYKYMLRADRKDITKAKLFDLAYLVAENRLSIEEIPYYVTFKMVLFDELRFKIPLSIR